nr:hypothetical protein MarFTME_332 [Marseillevirus futianmevirus]
MFSFLEKREKIAVSICDDEAGRELGIVIKRQREAAEKIRDFWRRQGRKMYVGDSVSKEKIIDDIKGTPGYSVSRALYDVGSKRGWYECCRRSHSDFQIGRPTDILSLFRITGKNVWKVELCSGTTSFCVYTKKRDKKGTFCVKFPFDFPIMSVVFSDVVVRVHGEEVERVEAKGALLQNEYRKPEQHHNHNLFYGRVFINGGTCTFFDRPGSRERNTSKICE